MPIEIAGTTVINDSRNIVNVNNFGNSDTVYTGNGANITGIEAGSASFTASGAISNGRAVHINSNGTVSVPTVSNVEPPTFGSETIVDSGSTQYIRGTFDSTNGKVVITYQDGSNSSYGSAIVGTVSGTSITFGDESVFNDGGVVSYVDVTYIGNDKVVVVYRDNGNSNKGTAIVGTISGNSISFGSETVYNTAAANYNSVTYIGNDKVVIAFTDTGNSSQGYAIVGTVSGTSISFGTKTRFETGTAIEITAIYDSSNSRVVIAYEDNSNSSYGTAVVGTVSGTSISFGTPVVFNSGTTYDIGATYESSNGKAVIIYRDAAVSPNRGTAIIGTVSGTSISFGSEVTYNNALTSQMAATDVEDGRVVITYRDAGNSNYGTAIIGTVSGTSISFGSEAVFNEASSTHNTPIYAANGKVVNVYRDGGNSNQLTAIVFTVSSTTISSSNFIGIAAEAISNGSSGSVTIAGGINSSQSSLTTAKKYYVQSDGTLDILPTTIEAGISISATKINVGA